METDIKNLPMIPDMPEMYEAITAYYNAFEYLQNNNKFVSDFDNTLGRTFIYIQQWRHKNLILDYPGDMKK